MKDYRDGQPAQPSSDEPVMNLPAPIEPPTDRNRGPDASRLRAVVKPRPSTPDRQIPDAIALFKAFRRRWIIALVAGVVLAVITAVTTFAVVPQAKYISRAMLSVSSNMPRILFPTGETRVDFGTYQKTQIAMIKSRRVLKAALDDTKVRNLEIVKRQTDPVSWLEREAQAEYSGEVLKIWMSGDSPEDLPALVNAITEAYRREVVGVDTAERRKRFESLKEIYDGYQKKLQDERKVMETLAEDIGSKDEQAVRLTQEMAMERRGLMEKELLSIVLDLRRAEAELAAQTHVEEPESAPNDPPKIAVDEYVNKDKEIAEFKSRRDKLIATLKKNSRISKSDGDPSIVKFDQEIKSIDRSIAKRAEEVRAFYIENWRLKSSGRGPAADEAIKGRVRILRELKRMAEADVALYKAESKAINKSSLGLEMIRDRISHMESISKRVGDEVEFLNVELTAPARVLPIEMANVPRREADRRQGMAGMAGMAAFLLAAVGISYLEFRARRIGSVEEVVGELELRVMASLPKITPRPGRSRSSKLTGPSAPSSRDMALRDSMIESVDSLCANLLHLNRVDGTRVVMVSSAVGAEGKTSLSCSLAQSLARAGRRTLLIDADLRRPAAHLMFDAVLGPGLSEVLRGESEAMEATREIAPGLWLMTAGEGDSRAIQALAHERLGVLFGRLKKEFDYIVVDTPPVLPVPDALLIGQHVDAVICAILRDVSRFPRVRAANERLKALEIRVLGAVVAGTRSEAYGSNYHYGYKTRGLV